MDDDPDRPRVATPRWGVRTLAFLALATASILTSNVLYARDDDRFVLLTFVGTVIGLVGAGVCTVRGLAALRRRDRRR